MTVSPYLTTLNATVAQLHGSENRDAAIETIHDVVLNVIGAEQVAVFEVDAGGSSLKLVSSVGVDPKPMREVGFGEGEVGCVAASGRLFVKRSSVAETAFLWEQSLTACIPLKIDRRLTGVIAIFGLKVNKDQFTRTDYDLFEALSLHAARALK